MKKLVMASVTALVVVMAGPAGAGNNIKPVVIISKAWARATPAAMKIGAAYLTLTSAEKYDDRLIGVSSPDADRVEVHSHTTKGGMMMAKIDSLTLPAGKSVVFKTGGLHFMLFGLKHRLIAGQDLNLTLVFAKAGRIYVTAKIVPGWSLGPALRRRSGDHDDP